MQGCHCAAMIWGFWHQEMPQSVQVALAKESFDHTNYKDIFEHADKVYLKSNASAEPAVVATIQPQNPPPAQTAAAVSRGRGRGARQTRGSRGTNRGNQNQGGGRGARTPNTTTTTSSSDKPQWSAATRHADNPPIGVCSEHWRSGSQAKWCYSPLDCPWVSRIVPRQNANKNQ